MNFKKISTITFPNFLGYNINMMPFVMGDIESIPFEYRQYYPLIEACNISSTELGKIGYLSISESLVLKGKTQRRPGVHTDCPGGGISWGNGGGGSPWGGLSGLYIASNIDDTCRVWDEFVESPGLLGDCSHLVESFGEPTYLKGNELYWLHDKTPHEALPLDRSTLRQWFRVVTSDVGIWYKKHSTPNRLGVQPNCYIEKRSKF